MSKIIGAKITENKAWELPNGQKGVTNKVDFEVVTNYIGEGCVGFKGRTFSCKISDLGRIFRKDPSLSGNVSEFVNSLLNRECIIESEARTNRDNEFQGDALVTVVFLDELPGAKAK